MSDADYLVEHSDRLEREFHRVRSRAAEITAQAVSVEIADRLGLVRVSGRGELVEIDLDPGAFRSMQADSLGPRIIAAIEAAERKAGELRATIREESAWRHD